MMAVSDIDGLYSNSEAVPVLMGIVWTNIYPSDDAHVVAPLVVGFFFLILFALWETYGKIERI